MAKNAQKTIALILHDIRSAHNVGSIFRTADATGVHHIYITGYTPRPHDGTRPYTTKPERGIIKTALGAEQFVPWSEHKDLFALLATLKKDGVRIVALEQDAHSISFAQYQAPEHCALILGNEPTGISQDILSHCDDIVEIPMYGQKKSLNVSVAAGVALYALRA